MVSPELFNKHIQESPHYFYPDVDWQTIEDELEQTATLSNSRRIKYFEVPIAFDIEVTSYKQGEDKYAWMYCWQLSIQGYVILGRTWEEFDEVYSRLLGMFHPNESNRLIIYVQNLSYEFQFICHRFAWQQVFCLKERKPIKAVTVDYVEFRCSYMLSGYSLELIGKNLQRYKILKLKGDLDYDLIRHSQTPLTEKEWGYCINDVQVVVAYIQETAENDGGFHKIPLTKTGYVREYCRNICFQAKNYRKLMKHLTVDAEEYNQLKRAFAGGFTHANWHYSDRTLFNMDSFDFTSSYPAVMVAEKFPMSKARKVEIHSEEEFNWYLEKYCCLFDIEIEDLDGWDAPDHILSFSKCQKVTNPVINNGRIITADRIITTITDVDYKCLLKFYKWKRYRIANMRIYDKMYLPSAFVRAILKLYQDKTELKDVEGKEVEYLKSKGMINATYGMTVTDIVRNEDTFDEEWTSIQPDSEEAINKYNNSRKRFLFYPWGIWVTAYARANLYEGILEFGDDYVYSDTDSIKALNSSNHSRFLGEYNERVNKKLKDACEYHNIDFNMTRPKTKNGVEKPLGVWDYDGHYTRFKTLGAKRYMTECADNITITVAGLNKKIAMPYITELANKNNKTEFDVFTNELYIPKGKTGKNIHSYIDYEISINVEDYLGTYAIIHEYSAVYMEQADYSLSLEEGYLRLLRGQKMMEL